MKKAAAETVAEVKKAAPAKKRTAAKKPTVNAVLQYAGKELSVDALAETAKSAWTGDAIKELTLYIKPEENRVYCVVNGEEAGSFEI